MLFGKLFTNPKMWVNGDADDITMGGVYTCKDVQNVPTGDGALLVFKTENTIKQVFIPVGEEGVVYTRVLGKGWANVTGTSEETEALIQSAIDKANQAQTKADTVDTRLNNIIVESGTSDAEVVAARTDSSGQTFTTLGQRLDTQFSEIKEDLYESQTITESGTNVIIDDSSTTADLISDTQSLTVTHTGKNLLTYPFYGTTQSVNGLTFTVNSDGTINVTGTATANTSYAIVAETPGLRKPILAGTYTLSGCPTRSANDNFDLFVNGAGFGGNISDTGNGATFTLAADTTYYMKIYVKNGQAMNHTFLPMIESGTAKTDWEKYKSETITLSNGAATATLYDGVNHFTASSAFAVSYTKYWLKKDMINIKDLGAMGDGITDDTEAIKNALLQGAGRTVFLPIGTYLFSETLVLQSGTTLKGEGTSSLLKLASTYSLNSYDWRSSETLEKNRIRKPYIMTAEESDGCTLSNFALEGQTQSFTDDNEDGIAILGSNHIVKNINIENIDYFPGSLSGRTSISPGEGIYVAFAKNVIIENVRVKSCGYEGIGTETCDTVLIQNCTVGKCNQTGIQVHRSSNHIKVIGNTVKYDTPGGGAMTLHAFPDNPMNDIQIAGNYFDGSVILVGGAENNLHISNNYIWGTLSCNNRLYRNRVVITGNVMAGGIILYADNVIITNNAIQVDGGTYMIRLYGNNNIVENNLAMGSVSLVGIFPHDN